MSFIKQAQYRALKPAKRWLRPWRSLYFGEIRVSYKRHLDGGGSTFGQNYIPLLRDWGMPRQARAFEWCSGPGFIGFSLLAHGLCDALCLADINPEAVSACRRTVAENRLTNKVCVYQSDNLENIPSSECWDLVVGNPPHFDWSPESGDVRVCDPGWNIHRGFFGSIGRFLKPNGVILLQENNRGSTAATFSRMIEEFGFTTVLVDGCEPRLTPYTRHYYVGVMRQGDTPPTWLAVGGRDTAKSAPGKDRTGNAVHY